MSSKTDFHLLLTWLIFAIIKSASSILNLLGFCWFVGFCLTVTLLKLFIATQIEETSKAVLGTSFFVL